MNKAVFLDRDGTLNSDEGHYYIYRPEDFVLNEGVVEGLKILQEKGYLLIVITNQGGVAKGEYTEEDVKAVHQKMEELLAEEGIKLTAFYYCPHHESVADCKCRKPSPFLIKQALGKYKLNPNKCYMIGDSERDVIAASKAGVRAFQIPKNSSIVNVCKKIATDED